MIVSSQITPSFDDFRALMKEVDNILNNDAKEREEYYIHRTGVNLEQDVFKAIKEAAIGTKFENTIRLVSGNSFPDISVGEHFGVEVKSTEKNHWTSIGSSILESTRIQNISHIFLTFGKLGRPVQFVSRPYEECLSGIAVTHYPRYQIDMRLNEGDTIFEKIGIPYNKLRIMKDPVSPVSYYYQQLLKDDESLWWAPNNPNTSGTIRLWTSISSTAKEQLAVQGYVFFPEVLSTDIKKYNRFSLWLVTQKGIVNTNIRDSFSAGGKVFMRTLTGQEIKMPAAYGRILKYRGVIESVIENTDENTLKEYWKTAKIQSNRIKQWCEIVTNIAQNEMDCNLVWSTLAVIFPSIIRGGLAKRDNEKALHLYNGLGKNNNPSSIDNMEMRYTIRKPNYNYVVISTVSDLQIRKRGEIVVFFEQDRPVFLDKDVVVFESFFINRRNQVISTIKTIVADSTDIKIKHKIRFSFDRENYAFFEDECYLVIRYKGEDKNIISKEAYRICNLP